MDKEHPLRYNEILRSSIDTEISDQVLDNILHTRMWIEEQQEQGYKVAIIHLSGDLTHAAHYAYIKTIIAKLKVKFGNNIKLAIGVEADVATSKRKDKINVFSEGERRYIFENIKGIDKCYIEVEGLEEQVTTKRPAGIVKYLSPDIVVSHQEHFGNLSEYIGASRRMHQHNGGKIMIVNYGDEEKYLGEESMRSKYNLSTTNIMHKIIKNFKGNSKYDF